MLFNLHSVFIVPVASLLLISAATVIILSQAFPLVNNFFQKKSTFFQNVDFTRFLYRNSTFVRSPTMSTNALLSYSIFKIEVALISAIKDRLHSIVLVTDKIRKKIQISINPFIAPNVPPPTLSIDRSIGSLDNPFAVLHKKKKKIRQMSTSARNTTAFRITIATDFAI